jgi:predicted dehydrogenase|tara:strand:+ start:1132 stop:2034 length:903 start_codon:yes stop_codon:yes gene_type:complete
LKYNVLIIGYGSIGKRHYSILKEQKNIQNIYFYTKQKIHNSIKNLNEIKKLNINYFVICSETNKHLNQIKWIDNNFKNIKVLVEKPLFHLYKNLKFNNNKYFVGFNMRFNPIINFLKKLTSNKNIYNVNIICSSYLPFWRNKNYKKSYSASKSKGGGVLLDLSHDLDYIYYMFGKYKVTHSVVKKLSNLDINVEDYANVACVGEQKNIHINFNLNYFSKLPIRILNIEGNNISIFADLIDKYVTVINKKGIKQKKVFKFDRNFTYKEQHQCILNNKSKNISKFNDGLYINKIINNIKKIS